MAEKHIRGRVTTRCDNHDGASWPNNLVPVKIEFPRFVVRGFGRDLTDQIFGQDSEELEIVGQQRQARRSSVYRSCPWKAECTKAKGHRQVRVSFRLQEFRTQARKNLLSEETQAFRARRSTEVETVFGQIKHNMRFRRFLLRGQAKVQTEWGLICMAHNMKKPANRTASSFVPTAKLLFSRKRRAVQV